MRARRRADRGLTLIELLIAATLTIILVGIMAVVFQQSSAVVSATDAKVTSYGNARIGLDELMRDLERLYATSDPSMALLLETGTVDVQSGPGGSRTDTVRADRIRFLALKRTPGGSARYELVDWRFEVGGARTAGNLRRGVMAVSVVGGQLRRPNASDDFAQPDWRVDEMMTGGAGFTVRYVSRGAAPGTTTLRDPFAGTTTGTYFASTGATGRVENGGILVPREPATTLAEDRLIPGDPIRIDVAADVKPFAPGEYHIRSIDRTNDPMRLEVIETLPDGDRAGNPVQDVLFEAVHLPAAISVELRLVDRVAQRGSLSRIYWLR